MKKKLLTIVAVFALALAMMPAMAFAETGIAENSIPAVDLNVTAPMHEQNTAYTTPDVSVPDGADYSVSGSGWRNNAAGDPLPYSIYFTAGRTYYFALELTAKEGFSFSPDAALNVSGGKLESKEISGAKATMIISVVASEKPFTPIENVSVTINVPTDGMTVKQAYDANKEQTLIPSGQHYRVPAHPSDGTYISWQYPSGSYMKDTYEFIEGSEYIAGVYLISEGDYDFTSDTKVNVSGGTVISQSIGTYMTQTTLSITVKVRIGDATHNTVSFDVNSGTKGPGWPDGDAITLDRDTKLNFSISGVNSESAEISVSGGTEAKVNATAPSGCVFHGISVVTQTESDHYSAGDKIPEYTLSQPLTVRFNWKRKSAPDKVDVTLKSPTCGTVITGNPEDKTSIPDVKVVSENCHLYLQPKWVSGRDTAQPFEGKIVGGENYKAVIMIAANDGYSFDSGKLPAVKVNGNSVKVTDINNDYITVVADVTADHGNAKTREEVVKAATCTENGTKNYIVYCPECNKELGRETDAIAASGHRWGEWKVVKEATQTEAGLKTRTCSSCGAEDSSSIPVKEAVSHVHAWDGGVVVSAPGCETAGETRYTCSICGETRTEHPEQTGHAAGEWTETVIRQNTCGHKGYVIRSLHCNNCGEVLTRILIPVDAVDHVWNSGKVTKTPTSGKEGSIKYTCTVCGETKTESLSLSRFKALKKEFKPGKVSLIKVKKSGKKVTAKWKRAVGADGYQLQIRKGKKTVKTVNVRSSGKTISRSVGKLKKKTKYTVRVRAYNNDIGVKIYGKWSKAKRFRTK